MAQYVDGTVCGVEIKGMILMESKFDGFDPHAKMRFKAGSQIAYKHKDQLTPEQTEAIYGKGKTVYNLTVQWPLLYHNTGDKKKSPAVAPVAKKLLNKVSFTPSTYQLAILDSFLQSDDHMLIEALAGSGKTSTLVWLLQELYSRGLSSGKKIVYLAFNKSIQEELAEKLQGTGVPAMTTHGFGFQLLKKKFGPGLNVKDKRPGELFQRILCDENGFRYSAEAFKEVRKSPEHKMRGPVLELVSYVKNWGVFPVDRDGTLVFEEEQIANMHLFIEMYEVEFDREKFTANQLIDYVQRVVLAGIPAPGDSIGEIDYDDMLFLPLALNLPVPKYDIVLTDESQDFNACQIMILEKLTMKGEVHENDSPGFDE